uniref:Gustatory receptor n=1 Tax=Anopheles albimanus TaxID=7167 RepID=A0A182FKY3_ANOAL
MLPESQSSSRSDFLRRLRRALWIQHFFGVSSIFIYANGKCRIQLTRPAIIVTIFTALYLLIAWLVLVRNEELCLYWKHADMLGLFFYFIIAETILALACYTFYIFSAFWRPSQTSLAQCWEILVVKITTFPNLYNRTVNTTVVFRIFWSWVIVLSLAFIVSLPTMVLKSPLELMHDINHFMFFFMRMFTYLAQGTICATFGFFAMLVRSLIRELQAVLHYGVMSSQAIRSIIQLYRHICQIINCFCTVYGWILLLIFFEHFIIITDRSFFAIRMYRLSPVLNMADILGMLGTWALPLIINDFLLTGSCAAAEKALQEFEKHLCNHGQLYEDNEELAFMVTSFTFYVAEQKPRFRILNALNLDLALLYAMFGIISAYLTVFLQFSPVE